MLPAAILVSMDAPTSRRLPSGQSHVAFAPSPGTPGEGWGEGDFECRCPFVLDITLTLTLSRRTGRGDQSARDAYMRSPCAYFPSASDGIKQSFATPALS